MRLRTLPLLFITAGFTTACDEAALDELLANLNQLLTTANEQLEEGDDDDWDTAEDDEDWEDDDEDEDDWEDDDEDEDDWEDGDEDDDDWEDDDEDEDEDADDDDEACDEDDEHPWDTAEFD